MRSSPPRFALIGPGRVGSSLASALVEAGWICTAIVCKHYAPSELKLLKKRFPKTRVTGSVDQLGSDFRVLLIAVKDDQIYGVVSGLLSLARTDWDGKAVLHLSGVVELAALSQLKKLGASIGALHPISPFATRFSPEHAQGTHYDFFGTTGALKIGREITRTLESKIIVLRSERERVALHLASVLASNSVVIAVKSAENIVSDFMKPADSRAILGNLLASTSNNISSNKGFKALTGPLVRGDLGVIARHIQALKGNRQLLQFYKSSQLVGVKGLLKEESSISRKASLKRIEKLLEE